MSDILDDYEDAMFDRGRIVEHIPIARLRELAEAEREGRVVIPPCKVGDKVYCLRNFHGKIHPIVGIVEEILFTTYVKPLIIVKGIGRGCWKEKIFATRAEAVSALAEKGEAT